MSKLTLEDAISHCLEVAEQNETSAITYKNCKEIKTNMYEKLTAEKAENDCRECAAEHRQLAKWLTELKEAKRLLRLAVEDINAAEACDTCKYYPVINGVECQIDDCYKWRYADEALALIGGEADE